MGPRIREDTGGDGRRLGTALRGTGEGMGPRIREDTGGDGRRLGTSLRGTGEGMGPRIREDKGGGTGDGQGRRFGVRERGWVPASARTRVGG